MNTPKAILVALAALAFASPAPAQEQRPYKDGPVVIVTYVKVKPGKFDEYMRYLAGPYRKLQEEQKRAGLVSGWNIYGLRAKTATDPDLVLSVTYPNMAALDRSDDFDAVGSRVMGSFSSQDKAFADRGTMRDILGSELMREVVLR